VSTPEEIAMPLQRSPSAAPKEEEDKDKEASVSELLGCVVRSPYGWGVVVEDDADSPHLRLALDWRLRDGSRAQASILRRDILERAACAVGQCVGTAFGSGVLLDFRRQDRCHVVRLWAPRGSRAATLYCRAGSLTTTTLRAAVGFEAKVAGLGRGIVRDVRAAGESAERCYHVDLGWGKAYCPESSGAVSSPAAAALPAAECVQLLARRELARTASALEGLDRGLQAASDADGQAAERLLESLFAAVGGSSGSSSSSSSSSSSDAAGNQRGLESLLSEGVRRLQSLSANHLDHRQKQLQQELGLPSPAAIAPATLHHYDANNNHHNSSNNNGNNSNSSNSNSSNVHTASNNQRNASGSYFSNVHSSNDDNNNNMQQRLLQQPLHPKSVEVDLCESDSASLPGSDSENLEEETLLWLLQRSGFAGDEDTATLRQAMAADEPLQRVLSELRLRRSDLRLLRHKLRETRTGRLLTRGRQRLLGGAEELRLAGTPSVSRLASRSERLLQRLIDEESARVKATELLAGAWQAASERPELILRSLAAAKLLALRERSGVQQLFASLSPSKATLARGGTSEALAAGVERQAAETLEAGLKLDEYVVSHEPDFQALLSLEPMAGWTFKTEVDGTKIYVKSDTSGKCQFKATGTLHTRNGLPEIIEGLTDMEQRKQWDELLIKCETLEAYTPFYRISYTQVRSPSLIISHRELLMCGRMRFEADGGASICLRSITDPDYSGEPGFVRATMEIGGYIIRPVAGKPNSFTMMWAGCADPSGWIPSWIANNIAWKQGLTLSRFAKFMAMKFEASS
ncbi:unnamed protein product, partial [Polarella glacialis]